MISTHTLTWSVTHTDRRPPHGAQISTHTLTWSVTCTQFGVDKCPKYFNSHAHVERDTRFTALALYYTNFNSHAHVERDQFFHVVKTNLRNFNSHAHVERDFTE